MTGKTEFTQAAEEFSESFCEEYYNNPSLRKSIEDHLGKIFSWDLISIYMTIRSAGHLFALAKSKDGKALELYPKISSALENMEADVERVKFLDKATDQFTEQTALMKKENPTMAEELLLAKEKSYYFRDDIVARETSEELQKIHALYREMILEQTHSFFAETEEDDKLAEQAIRKRMEQNDLSPAARLGLSFLDRMGINVDELIVDMPLKRGNGENGITSTRIHTLFYEILFDRFSLDLGEFNGNFCEAYLNAICLEHEEALGKLSEPLRKDAEAEIVRQWKTWKNISQESECSQEFTQTLKRIESMAAKGASLEDSNVQPKFLRIRDDFKKKDPNI